MACGKCGPVSTLTQAFLDVDSFSNGDNAANVNIAYVNVDANIDAA